MTWLYDSHIHLSDLEYANQMSFIMTAMKKMRIKACCVSMDVKNSLYTLELSRYSDLLLPFIGIHPEHSFDDLNSMLDLITKNKNIISGIGEIGLDKTYTKNHEDFLQQKNVFSSLLSLAEKFQKPISVHSRKTLGDVFDILSSFTLSGVLLHWFDGNKKQLATAMDKDYFVSYGPLMLYANDKQVLLQSTLKEKILVETDGPVRFSRCFAQRSAQISFIPSVVFCASKLLRITYSEMSNQIEQNSKTYLGI